MGAVAVREDINLEPAFWAQFPGNENYRRPARAGLKRQCRGPHFPARLPHGARRGQSLGRGRHPARDDRRRRLIISTSTRATSAISPSSAPRARARRWCSTSCSPRRASSSRGSSSSTRTAAPNLFIRAIGGRYDLLGRGTPSGLNPLLLPDTPGQPPVPDRLAGLPARRRGHRRGIAGSRTRSTPISAQPAEHSPAEPPRANCSAAAAGRTPGDLWSRLRPVVGRRRARLAVRQRARPTDFDAHAASAST